MDMINLIIYFTTFILRMITWGTGTSVPGNRQLVIAQYLYGLNAAILTVRVFGSLLEANKDTGITHIALVFIMEDVAVIFVQFAVGILACSLAMTKVLLAELSFTADDEVNLRSKGLEILTFLILSIPLAYNGLLFYFFVKNREIFLTKVILFIASQYGDSCMNGRVREFCFPCKKRTAFESKKRGMPRPLSRRRKRYIVGNRYMKTHSLFSINRFSM